MLLCGSNLNTTFTFLCELWPRVHLSPQHYTLTIFSAIGAPVTKAIPWSDCVCVCVACSACEMWCVYNFKPLSFGSAERSLNFLSISSAIDSTSFSDNIGLGRVASTGSLVPGGASLLDPGGESLSPICLPG